MGETVIGIVRGWGKNFLSVLRGEEKIIVDGPPKHGEERLGEVARKAEERVNTLEREYAEELLKSDEEAEARYKAIENS